MKIRGFLVVNSDGNDTKFLVKEPPWQRGAIAIPVHLEVPQEVFYPPKMPTVEVSIDESVIPQIKAINEHCEALQDAGVKIRLVDNRGGE